MSHTDREPQAYLEAQKRYMQEKKEQSVVARVAARVGEFIKSLRS